MVYELDKSMIFSVLNTCEIKVFLGLENTLNRLCLGSYLIDICLGIVCAHIGCMIVGFGWRRKPPATSFWNFQKDAARRHFRAARP